MQSVKAVASLMTRNTRQHQSHRENVKAFTSQISPNSAVKWRDLVFLSVKTVSETIRGTADVIRGARAEGTSDKWAWVSELSKCHCYSDLWKHTENNPHCTCNLHSKVGMEKHDTKGSNPVTGQGQARVREGGKDASRLARHNAIISTFPPPMRVANDSPHRVAKTRKCGLLFLWPFHPDLMFACGLISIDWVYLAYTT